MKGVQQGRGLVGALLVALLLVLGPTAPGTATSQRPLVESAHGPSAASEGPDKDWREVGASSLAQEPSKVVDQTRQAGPQRVVLVREDDGRPTVEVRPVTGRTAAVAEVARAQADPSVVAVEVDQPVTLLDHPTPPTPWDDPLRAHQWALDLLRAEESASVTGPDPVEVAVLDTGVRGRHEDLRGAVLTGRSLVPGEEGGDGWNDGNGHGTHVAGTVVARTGNATGVAGLYPRAHVLPVRVLDDRGEGSISTVAEGLRWAVDEGVEVANMSLGAAHDSDVLHSMVAYAQSQGVLVVAAAGNDRQEGNPTFYPAAYPGVLAVGATNSSDRAAGFSSSGNHLGVAAPGVEILSTYPGGYAYSSGTSMAAPHASAVAAQVMSTYPALSAQEVAALLRHTALDLGAPCHDQLYGAGRLRPRLALELGRYAQRLCAEDRYGTARAVALERTVNPEVVYVANGTNFPGSMTASATSGRDGAALLLVRPTRVPGATARALEHLRPKRIEVVGGPAAVSSSVLEQLRGYTTTGTVDRRWGSDRYGTAADLAESYGRGVPVAYVANGVAFPGAMTAGAVAGRDGAPLLLVRPSGVPNITRDALNRLRPGRIVLVGGPEAVSDTVLTMLREYAGAGGVDRVWGEDRYETAAKVADDYSGGVNTLYVANGTKFPGAMTAGAPAGRDAAPLLLVKPGSVPPSTSAAIERLAPDHIVLVGGPAAVTEDVRDALSRIGP